MKLDSMTHLPTHPRYTRGAAALILLASASAAIAAPGYDSVTSTDAAISEGAGSEHSKASLYNLFHQPRFNTTDGLDDYSESLPPARNDAVVAGPKSTSDLKVNVSAAATASALVGSGKKDAVPARPWFRRSPLNVSDELADYSEDFRWTSVPKPVLARR